MLESLADKVNRQLPIPDDLQCPCRNLIAAILARGIEDAFGNAKRPRQIIRESNGWIFSEENTPFTYIWCCTTLDLNPYYLRYVLAENKYRFEPYYGNRGGGHNTTLTISISCKSRI